MITCRELIEVLLDFESGELAAEPREHVERHLEHCSSCVAFLETYRLTIKLSRRLPRPALPVALKQRLEAILTHSDEAPACENC